MTMKTRISLLAIIPLGAGLLYLGSLASDPPGASERPAFSVARREIADDTERQVDVLAGLAAIEYAPARSGFLETVVMQGTVGDRKAAIFALRQLATDEAIGILSIALGDEDPRVRKAAFEALAHIGGDEALAAIASASADDDPVVRARAAEALANAGGYSATDYLELALRDEDARVRATAVAALGDLNGSHAVNIISQALRDPDPEVRERATELLEELNDDALFHALYPAL
jgi:HEAT repeat protein